jgi:DeoR/GlpR family transcriptional regulator of sugar metabolism
MVTTATSTRLLTEQRRNKILDIVQTRGMISVDELIGELGVSSMTLWRDLFNLDQAGKVRRVHGGVARLEKDINNEPGYNSKQIQY